MRAVSTFQAFEFRGQFFDLCFGLFRALRLFLSALLSGSKAVYHREVLRTSSTEKVPRLTQPPSTAPSCDAAFDS